MNLLSRINKLELKLQEKVIDQEEIRDRFFRKGSLSRALCEVTCKISGGDVESKLQECYKAELSGGNGLSKALSEAAKINWKGGSFQ